MKSVLLGNRGPTLRAVGLTLPLVAFIGVTFLAPLAAMLVRSVYDPVVADALPETMRALASWDGEEVPDEAVFAALATELVAAGQARTVGQVATRLNRVESGLRSVVTRTARGLRNAQIDPGVPTPWRNAVVAAADAWEDPGTWRAVRRAGERDA